MYVRTYVQLTIAYLHCRVVKEFIAALGANVTSDAVTRLGKSLGPLYAFSSNYLAETAGCPDAGRHAPAIQHGDIKTMVKQLMDEGQVFTVRSGRKQAAPGKYSSLLHKQTETDIRKWLKKACKNILLSN